MGLSNAELLERLNAAFKAVTIGDLNEGILVAEQFDRFIQIAQHRTVLMQEARFIKMDRQQVNIDRTGFMGRILRAGRHMDPTDTATYGKTKVLADSEHVRPQFMTNKLVAEELQAITGIEDQALRRNIERGKFENTLISMFGEAAGRDLEEWFILADKDIPMSTDAVLSLIDGWIKSASNKVYGSGGEGGFNPSSDEWPSNMFEAMLEALPKQYFQNEAEWRFYVDWEIQNAYREQLKKRETALGDDAVTKASNLFYKGIPVKYVPMLGRSKPVAEGGAGRVSMLLHPDNTVWGIFHEITIERDRIPKGRRTDFVLTLEGDAGYEDENAAVVSFIDQDGIES